MTCLWNETMAQDSSTKTGFSKECLKYDRQELKQGGKYQGTITSVFLRDLSAAVMSPVSRKTDVMALARRLLAFDTIML